MIKFLRNIIVAITITMAMNAIGVGLNGTCTAQNKCDAPYYCAVSSNDIRSTNVTGVCLNKIALNASCTSSAQCSSTVCDNNICTKYSISHSCSQDSNCISNNCNSSVCRPLTVALGAKCDGTNVVCPTNINCYNNVCGSIDASCNGGSNCISGECTGQKCVAKTVILGASCDGINFVCTGNATCVENLCKNSIGGSCVFSTNCISNNCNSNVCKSTTVALGAKCDSTNLVCPTGSTCGARSKACRGTTDIGGSCSTTHNCKDGLSCQSGVCIVQPLPSCTSATVDSDACQCNSIRGICQPTTATSNYTNIGNNKYRPNCYNGNVASCYNKYKSCDANNASSTGYVCN